MSDVLQDLVSQLDLETIETNLFRGVTPNTGQPRVFGGQVIAQALAAAARTVEARPCHSLHGYFLRPGDPTLPIIYNVDRIRDGKSFTTRRVVAIQKGQAIFNMSASFQVIEQGLSHQASMPDVPGPEDCVGDQEMFSGSSVDEWPAEMQRMMAMRPIEIRRVEPYSFVNPVKRPPFQHVWFRARGPVGDDPVLHQCLLAYASDMGILSTSTLPHGKSFMKGLMTASLDHAMWFHRPINMEEWILFAQDSPAAAGARGFNRGTLFTQAGELIASVAQEGLMRELANS
jgi:acyl-CoA thioesterase-2